MKKAYIHILSHKTKFFLYYFNVKALMEVVSMIIQESTKNSKGWVMCLLNSVNYGSEFTLVYAK